MVLVDTTVLVAHLRDGTIGLKKLLHEGLAVCHPFIIGELACGNLKHRSEIIVHLQALPQAVQAENHEVMRLIENYSLMGKGLGFIDMHLLASAKLTRIPLWTLDKKLNEVVAQLDLTPP